MKSLIAVAMLALSVLQSAVGAEPDLRIFRAGTRAVDHAPAEYFTGAVKVEMLFTQAGPNRSSAGLVTFSPGARTAWHTHPLGQRLVVTSGIGRIQRWGGPVEEIRVGDVIEIPANVKHWHGAAPDSAMSHIAITEQLDGKAVEWLEKVDDQQYMVTPTIVAGPAPTSQGQQLFGDVAPKFAQLTDDVLFGDVWARPGLSQRDRSLITVSALIAMNRPDQLRGHLARARTNGVSDAELIEVVTHLAFYAGWPSAVTVTAIGVARDVFREQK